MMDSFVFPALDKLFGSVGNDAPRQNLARVINDLQRALEPQE